MSLAYLNRRILWKYIQCLIRIMKDAGDGAKAQWKMLFIKDLLKYKKTEKVNGFHMKGSMIIQMKKVQSPIQVG